jgi:hypothetical protein
MIKSEHYFTAEQGLIGACANSGTPLPNAPDGFRYLVFCVLSLDNGYITVGKHFCTDSETFNLQLSRQLARDEAMELAKVHSAMEPLL